jgi:hypothetical protein
MKSIFKREPSEQENNWLRLRSDLVSYLQEMRISCNSNSSLSRLILSTSTTTAMASNHHEAAAEDMKKLRESYTSLATSHQCLKKDHQKLIGTCFSRIKRLKKLESSFYLLDSNFNTIKNGFQQSILCNFFPAVTKELTSALEVAARSGIKSGRNFNWTEVIQNCSRLYPELFPTSSRIKTAGSRSKKNLEVTKLFSSLI